MACLTFQPSFQLFQGGVILAKPELPSRLVGDIGSYRLGNTIGRGQFGEVKRAQNVVTGQCVAVKIVTCSRMNERIIRKEIALQRRLDHPHIVNVLDVMKTTHHTYIVMELVARGDLLQHLMGNARLHESEARRLFQQLIAGVEHLHMMGIVHRDLKPENILLDADLNVKIGDFGVATELVEGQSLTESCGSPNYAAPEILSVGCRYRGPEVDVWSSGVILYTLLCSCLPFDAESLPELVRDIKGGHYDVPGHVSLGANDLLSNMLTVNPKQRIVIAQIREHSWFKQHLPFGLLQPIRPQSDTH